MCGIVGQINYLNSNNINVFENIKKLTDKLHHRGPDDKGIWLNSSRDVCIGHTRLSILDLSKNGSQPMISKNSRYVISYNGEIYNHLNLRKELEEVYENNLAWNSSCDTETLLRCIEKFGVKETLNKSKGMFSFAVWDNKLNQLTLVRDRIGEKPLYYGWVNDSFVFSSELGPIKLLNKSENKINEIAINAFFNFNFIPAPHTIYKNIYKLEPGKIFTITLDNMRERKFNIESYWDLKKIATVSKDFNKDYNLSPYKLFDEKLNNVIQNQLISDVPIGVFLSGGLDSTLVTAIASKKMENLKTFTVGFDENNFSELKSARKIANYLKTDHTEIMLNSNELENSINKINEIYQEPFADSSQIPTYLICKNASKYIKVALTGDGGDETFGGYNRYIFGPRIWNSIKFLPNDIKKIMAFIFNKIPNDRLYFFLKFFLNLKNRDKSQIKSHIQKIIEGFLFSNNLDEFLYSMKINFKYKDKLLKNNLKKFDTDQLVKIYSKNKVMLNSVEKLMLDDSLTYLPDDILTKVDRASMYCSLETRCPYLDNEIIEFSWKNNLNLKIKKNEGKLFLRNILKNYIPNSLTEKPKQGFAMPVNSLLKSTLKNWATELIYDEKEKYSEFLNFNEVELLWKEHLSNKCDNSAKLWSILVFVSWLSKI
tara:strand:+ start:10332 stop:12293 length:1962 start_codon:yes stop_codon:yes gene_type:complete